MKTFYLSNCLVLGRYSITENISLKIGGSNQVSPYLKAYNLAEW
jgi:hypothetical protein